MWRGGGEAEEGERRRWRKGEGEEGEAGEWEGRSGETPYYKLHSLLIKL